jgi:hypothetical protein
MPSGMPELRSQSAFRRWGSGSLLPNPAALRKLADTGNLVALGRVRQGRQYMAQSVQAPREYDAIILVSQHLGYDRMEAGSMTMSRGPMSRFSQKFALVLLALSLCVHGAALPALAQKGGVRKSAKKKQDPAPLPAYTPGPLTPMPLDQLPAVAPKVNFQGGQLTVQAHNSTLADVLREIRKQIGADFDVPSNATERVVADIGPGPARDVLTELLNGTHFNYVIVGSLTDPTAVRNVLLTPKTTGPETASAAPPTRPGMPQRMLRGAIPPAQAADTSDDNSSDSADDPPDQADAQEEQPQGQPPDQPNQAQQTPKTPEQLLQELQRQQQQQQSGQQPPSGQPQPGLFPNQPPTAQPNPNKPD